MSATAGAAEVTVALLTLPTFAAWSRAVAAVRTFNQSGGGYTAESEQVDYLSWIVVEVVAVEVVVVIVVVVVEVVAVVVVVVVVVVVATLAYYSINCGIENQPVVGSAAAASLTADSAAC